MIMCISPLIWHIISFKQFCKITKLANFKNATTLRFHLISNLRSTCDIKFMLDMIYYLLICTITLFLKTQNFINSQNIVPLSLKEYFYMVVSESVISYKVRSYQLVLSYKTSLYIILKSVISGVYTLLNTKNYQC